MESVIMLNKDNNFVNFHVIAMADIAIEIPGIEKNSLIDMVQRDTLIADGRAAMKAQIQDLIQMVDHFECNDEHTQWA